MTINKGRLYMPSLIPERYEYNSDITYFVYTRSYGPQFQL